MKAISIYTITRNQNTEYLQKLERQLSGRDVFLKIREWELDSMKALVSELERHIQAVYALRFFYSFQIPRLGKEFDLLQIKEEQILNLELKSGQVSDEAIRKQLIQNRYYLAALGKPIRSYTYISSQNRLVRLTNHDRIVEADWEQLCRDLQQESADYPGDIEDLFQAELYLISPLTEPGRFLKKEYFLTYQQRDIERQILKKIRADRTGYFWFTGLPGTGKTLLLYDIAMKLSGRQRVCMIHCGEAGKEWKVLHERLRRVEEKYAAVEREIRRLEKTGVPGTPALNRLLTDRGTAPVPDGCRLIDLLRRPQVGYDDLTPFDPAPPGLPPAVREQVEITVKYEGYIRRQEKQVEEFEKLERRRLPPDMDYSHIQGLRLEAREKLAALRPENLGQAGRISGVSPADIAALMVYLHTRETPPEGGTST
mgnify:CR=1 FL=1